MTDLREAMRGTATANDLSAVDVPEWKQKVYIRKLTVREMESLSRPHEGTTAASIRVLLASIVDEQGNRLLTDEDFDLLMDQPFGLLMPLMAEAGKQNGLTSKEVEEAVELFTKARGDSNGSKLPSHSGLRATRSTPSRQES